MMNSMICKTDHQNKTQVGDKIVQYKTLMLKGALNFIRSHGYRHPMIFNFGNNDEITET